MIVPETTGFGTIAGGFEVPVSIDKMIGNSSEAGAVAQSGGLYQNPEMTAYVDRIGQKIVTKTDRPSYGYKFGIVQDPAINAFALPNGSIYVTLGLLRNLRSDAQLAHVLGHEIGHVDERHGIKQMGLAMGVTGVLALASSLLAGRVDQGLMDTAAAVVQGLSISGYSREHEDVADEKGQEFAANAGWDPSGMVDVMEVFTALEGVDAKKDIVARYFRSHPFASDRLRYARRRVAELPKGELGTDTYQQFLTSLMEMSERDAALSPVDVEVPGLSKLASDPLFIPAVILLGGGLTVLFLVLLLRR